MQQKRYWNLNIYLETLFISNLIAVYPLISSTKSGPWLELEHVQNLILCKAADLNQQPLQEKGVCSDWNSTSQLLQMAARKSLETMSGNDFIDLHDFDPLATKVCSQISCKMKSDVWKPCSDVWKVMFESQWPALTGQALIFDFNMFWAIYLCKQSSTLLLNNVTIYT